MRRYVNAICRHGVTENCETMNMSKRKYELMGVGVDGIMHGMDTTRWE